MEMSEGVSLLRTAQSLLTGRTIPHLHLYFETSNYRILLNGLTSFGNARKIKEREEEIQIYNEYCRII